MKTIIHIWLLVSFALLGFTGCKGVVSVAPGSDAIVVHAEWLAENALNSVDQFLKWERENEAVLLEAKPGIHAVADTLRVSFKAQLVELRSVTRQYKSARDAESGKRVEAATAAVLSIVNSVRAHMSLPPLSLPAASPSVSDLMRNAPTNGPPQ